MFCIKCGRQIPDDAVFCPACGATQGDQMPQAIAPNQPAAWKKPVSPEEDALAGSILTWGILGLAFSEIPILGLIFSIIARVKCGNYARLYGRYTGKAKVGSTLATLGLVFSIIFTVAIAIVIIVAISEADRVEDYYDAYRYAYKYY